METEQLEMQALYYKALEDYRTPEKHDEAFMFLQQAADRGYPEASKKLGALFLSGQYDPYPVKDPEEAVKYIQKAAQSGDEEAMYWLSQCYEMGVGIKPNKREARFWRNLAVRHGFEPDDGSGEEKKQAEVTGTSEPQTDQPQTDQPQTDETPKNEPQTDEPKEDTSAADKDEVIKAPAWAKDYRTPKAGYWQSDYQAPARPVPKEEEGMADWLDGRIGETQKQEEDRQKEHDFQEAVSQQEEEEKEIQIKADQKTVSGFSTAGLVTGFAVGALPAVLFWQLAGPFTKVYAVRLFIVLAVCLALALAAGGWALGRKAAGRKVRRRTAFRQTPFYAGFPIEKDRWTDHEKRLWEVYQALSGNFLPVSRKSWPDTARLNQFRGLMCPGWTFEDEGQTVKPDFILADARTVYMVTVADDDRISLKDLEGRADLVGKALTKAGGFTEGQLDLAVATLLPQGKVPPETLKEEETQKEHLICSGRGERLLAAIETRERTMKAGPVSKEQLAVCLSHLSDKKFTKM